jgi:predicted nucleotidyltransferase
MTRKSYDISGKIDKYPLEIIESIKTASDKLNIPFFILGATARDIILEYVYSKRVFRVTNDIDIGVSVNSWDKFDAMMSLLVEGNKFSRDKKIEHRLLFNDTYPVNILPFGKIASESGAFKWPKEQNEFTVIGFDEAYASSDLVKVKSNPDLTVKFASPHSLVVLKIISWNERYPERSTDATDIILLIESYLEAGNQERLYNEEADLVNENFDFTFTGARLLGRDIARVFNNKTLNYVLNILDDEINDRRNYRLIRDMMRPQRLTEESKFDYYLKILISLQTGIKETIKE